MSKNECSPCNLKIKKQKKDSIYVNFLNTTAKYMFLLNLESALCSIYSQIVPV